jgi:hypothetical protein
MVVLIEYNQTRAYFQRQRKHEFARQSFVHMEISMIKGLVNLTFAYPSILTASIYRIDISELLRRWYVVLLPCVWEPCSLEARSVGTMLYDWGCKVRLPLCMWASADLSGAVKTWKGRGAASWLFVCMSCLSVRSHGSLTLSIFLSLSFLSLSLFVSFIFLSLFFYLSFFSSKPWLTPSWNKDTPLVGWNLQQDAQRFPPHLEFYMKVKSAMSGSPFECVPSPKSVKVFSWFSPHVLGHRMSPVLLNRHLKWLGPRIPEGAYYA